MTAERPCKNKAAHEAHDYCPGPASIHVTARCPGVSAASVVRWWHGEPSPEFKALVDAEHVAGWRL